MGTRTGAENAADGDGEELTLHVDERGRVTIPKSVRDRLGIDPDDDVPAFLEGSVLTVDPKPSAKLETVTVDRDDWANSTPTDAGRSLFGSMDPERREAVDEE